MSKKSTLCLAIAAATFAMGNANAQSNLFEEVVVTAQKREQNMQDVSIAVTAFSGDVLRELNMTNSTEIASQVPGLNIGTPVGEGNNPSITLRGVGLNDFNDNNEGPIAVYRDEVYQSAMAGLTFQLFDMERVEVLRGPQGTLYGRNATGGLVHFISKKPSEEFEGYADLTLAEYNQVKFEGAVGGSLGGIVQGRLSIATNQHDGYVDNRVGPDANEADSFAYRAQLNIDITDELSALINIHGGESDTIAPKYQHEVTDFDGDGVQDAVDAYGYADTDGDVWAGEYDRDGLLDIENEGASLTIDYSGAFEFVSITAYEQVDKIHEEDSDMGPRPAVEPIFGADIEQFSQEFRISGSSDSLTWVAGAYYFDSDVENTLDLNLNQADGFVGFLDSLPEADGGFGGGLAGLTGYAPGEDPGALIPFVTYDVDYTQSTESTGLFGQIEYQFTDTLKLIAGLRYTTEEREFDYLNAIGDRDGSGTIDLEDGALNSFFTELGGLGEFPPFYFQYTGDIDNDNISGKIGLDYTPSDDLLVFASFARGFKSGGFNGGFLDLTDGLTEEDTPYEEEILNSYEIGLKSTFADGALRLNTTAFYYDYEDFQALGFSGLSQFINNSDAEVKGMDLEIVWSPVDALSINLGASFLDTNVEELTVQGETITDTEMVLAPEFTFNGVIHYYATDALSFQVDFNHQGDHFFDITNSAVSEEDAYTVFNARIGYQINENVSVAAFVKNLTEEEYRVYTFDFTPATGFNQQFFAPPRWAGINVNVTF